MLLDNIIKGEIPEVPFKVTVDDKSILKIAAAAIMAAVVIMLVHTLLKK